MNPSAKQKVQIDFLYLDLTQCERCKETAKVLATAVEEAAKSLKQKGLELEWRKIHVDTREKAIAHRFLTSPTIRVNGQDIQMDYQESNCRDCGEVCGCDDGVACREWIYEGKTYTVPPKAFIVESILSVLSADRSNGQDIATGDSYLIPENLETFFQGKQRKEREAATNCGCDPSCCE
ncbi:MAG: DUF2703 domain-containing protein [Caldithrix sp.]|nr:DUF2703 domain-containing protein [Caldithrix sp.]